MVALPIYFILLMLPMVEEKRRQDENWQRSFYRLRLFMQVCLSAVAAWIVYTTQNPGSLDPALGLGVALCVLFAGFGLLTPADGKGNALAIRTPWTRNNPALANKTQRFTRTVWGLGGLLGIPLVLLVPSAAQLPVSLLWMLFLAFSPVAYSWSISRKLA